MKTNTLINIGSFIFFLINFFKFYKKKVNKMVLSIEINFQILYRFISLINLGYN